MTGRERSTRERFGAILFAFVMVTSVMAVGIGGFAGSAAAASDGGDPSIVNAETNGGDGDVDVFVSFDEEVFGSNNADGALDTGDFTLSAGSFGGDGVEAVSGGSPSGSAVYKVDVTGITAGTTTIDVAGSSVFDAEGNAVTSSAQTITDDGDPEIVAVETEVGGTSGTVFFSEPVADDADGDLEDADLEVDSSGGSISTGSGGVDIASHTGGDAVAQVTFDASVEVADLDSTTVSPADGSSAVEEAGNTGDFAADGSTGTLRDTSVPTITSLNTVDANNDGDIDRLAVTMSEAVDDDTLSTSGFSLATGTVETVSSTGSTDDTSVRLSVSGIDGTDLTPDATLIANGVEDNSAENSLGANQAPVTPTDSAQPVLLSATQTSTNTVQLSFSEAVQDDDGGDETDIGTDDISYTDSNSVDNDGISSVSDAGNTASDGVIQVTTNTDLSGRDIGSDQIAPVAADGAGSDGIQDTTNSNPAITSQSTIEAPAVAGALVSITGDSNTLTQDVVAGSANESVGEITLEDDPSDADAAFAGETRLTFPEGVTINTSASTLNTNAVITSQNDGVSIDSVDVTNNDRTIVLDHSGASNNGEEIRIADGAVVLNVNASQLDTSTTSTALNVELDTFSGTADATGLLTVFSSDATTPLGAPARTVSSGVENAPLGGGDQVRIDDGDLSATIEGTSEPLIGNNSEIVLTLEDDTGVTFDTDQIGDDLLKNEELSDGDSDNELNENGISVSSKTITIPVVDDIKPAATTDIDVQNLVVATTGDATNANLNVSVTGPAVDNGPYVLDDGDQSSTIDNFVQISNPDLIVEDDGRGSSQKLSVGAFEQEASTANGIDGVADSSGGQPNSDVAFTVEATGQQMAAGENVTITLNNSDVTFDTSQAVADAQLEPDTGDAADFSGIDDETIHADYDDENSNLNVDGLTVNENSIEISLTDTGGNTESRDNDQLHVGDVELNVSNTVADETDVELQATTRSGAAAPDVTVSATESGTGSAQFFTLERRNAEFNGNANQNFDADNSANITTDLDNDGFESREVTGGTDALVLNTEGTVTDETNVTISLEDNTGITFDTTAGTSFSNDGLDNSQGDSSVDVNFEGTDTNAEETPSSVTINDNSIDITLLDGDDDGAGSSIDGEIVVDDLVLNASSGAANTTVSVTTNTSDSEVTTDVSSIILNEVDPQDIKLDPDRSDGNNFPSFAFGADQSVSKPAVDSTITSGVKVRDGGSSFGGATVNLEVISTPNGSSGAQLNTTQATTDSNGEAFFNFTAGDTTGDYVVNATVESTGAGVNVTYTAQPGGIAGLSVTPIENAIAGDGSEVGTASLFINATDANGNPVAQSATVSLTADGVGAGDVTAFDDKASDGTGTSQSDNLQDGQFSLDSDGSSVIDVDSSQVENVTITAETSGESDDGTVTFFDQVGGIDLSLNETSVAVDDTVSADATITEEDGTTIEVPDVNVDFDDNNNGNTTFDADADAVSATTNDAGVASVNVTAEQLGSSTIDVQSNLRSDSATITVEEAGTGSPLDGPAGRFDNNGDGDITVSELGDAGTAFAEGELTVSELGEVGEAFAS